MKDPNKQIILYLRWPESVAQWFAHYRYAKLHERDEFLPEYIYNTHLLPHELEPVDIGRGGLVNAFLGSSLRKQPEAGGEDTRDCNIALMIPNMYGMNMQYYTYLGERERGTLYFMVRDRLIVSLMRFIRKADPSAYRRGVVQVKSLIEMWMEQNGVEINDTNYNYLVQIYQREYGAERKRSARQRQDERYRTQANQDKEL